jgi:hypothetical protein
MEPSNRLQRRLGGGILLLAILIAIMSFAFILMPDDAESDEPVSQRHPTVAPSMTPTETLAYTPTPQPTATIFVSPTQTPFPTADPNLVATSAAQPLTANIENISEITRDENPYTFNREAERTDVIQYIVQRGDNINDLAEDFGISLETIIWSNDRFYINALRPGFVLNILPVDGAIHSVQELMTVQQLADLYQVDPYNIIDSDYNALKDAVPESIIPIGYEVVIPDGTGSREPIYWEPAGGVASNSEQTGTSGGAAIYGGQAHFGIGQPGSCGDQPIYGGTLPSVKPLYGYVFTNDFTWEHHGVDLSAPLGTRVNAVGGGTVIFAGWSDWGYGWTVVIAHGPVMSLYGHLTGDFVWCGQQVEAGQHIGNVGSTGNSSGPHLHFEIRNASGIPVDPKGYIGF